MTMARYIDANALLKAMDTWDKFGFSHSGAFVREPENDDYVPYVHYADMVKCVEGMQTADVRENVRAHWDRVEMKKSEWWHTCSKCKATWGSEDEELDFNFCPNCGAEMSE